MPGMGTTPHGTAAAIAQTAVVSLTPLVLLYAIPIALVAAAIVVAIVLVVMRLARNPVDHVTSGMQVPAAPQVAPEGRWNAHVRRAGHLDAFTGFGTLALSAGWLAFIPEGATQPAWSYPAVSFGIRVNFVLANNDLTVDSAATGPLQVVVSHESINRVSRNNFKTLRERDTAGEFVRAMRSAGATILS